MSNEIVTTKNKQKQDISIFLEKNKQSIALALPKHVTADRLMRVALTEIRRNPALAKCSQISLISAIVQSAQLGIMPDSLTGQAYLIPYGTDCQLQIGYKGLMTLAFQSGQVLSINAYEVYKNDTFEYEEGLEPRLKHIPNFGGERKKEDLICVYATAQLKNGERQCRVMTIAEVDFHKKHSKSANGKYSPWVTHYGEMAKKTVIRALCKYLPQSTENLNLYKAVAIDEQADIGEQNNALVFDNVLEGEFTEEKPITKASEVAQKLTGKTTQQEEFIGEDEGAPKSLEEAFGEEQLTDGDISQ